MGIVINKPCSRCGRTGPHKVSEVKSIHHNRETDMHVLEIKNGESCMFCNGDIQLLKDSMIGKITKQSPIQLPTNRSHVEVVPHPNIKAMWLLLPIVVGLLLCYKG